MKTWPALVRSAAVPAPSLLSGAGRAAPGESAASDSKGGPGSWRAGRAVGLLRLGLLMGLQLDVQLLLLPASSKFLLHL